MARFSCDHCGMLQVVERLHGSISLKPWAHTDVAQAPPETDAEAEIDALRKAVISAENKHRQKQTHWKSIRANRLKEWTEKLSAAERGAASIKRITMIASVLPSALIAAAAWGIARENMAPDLAVIVGIATLPVAALTMIVLSREFVRNSDHYGVARLKRECSLEFAKTDGRISTEMKDLEKRILQLKISLAEAEHRLGKK